MASLGKSFNATEHDTEQRGDYTELPNGVYKLEIEASDIVPTKAGNGTILKTTMSVVEPEELKGRKLFESFNLENQNAQAQEIGQRAFASLCRAVGIDSVEDSEQLHFISFTAKIGLGKPSKDGQYPARAEIKRYFFEDEGNLPEPAIDANQPARAAPANDNRPAPAAAKPAAATAPAGRRPWGAK
ncbi:DUF669 domain-containing protein [Rhizobium laguerreae]|uniref:DUF669 domain-containing protein n=1 Tax=Rhizobium laguerreae TaxID=1076926 RepID=UPI001C924C3F|nr:DUF669 domain-containing protein [Rhizobium laguerreae]MBY3263840.1 DUF669 domain-containing protein [Rhizobium laguerreae]